MWFRFYFILFFAQLVLSARAQAQQAFPNDSSEIHLLQVARELMQEARYCALITLDDQGRPRVRLMDAFDPDSSMVVWLATNPRSRKVVQIRNDRRVTLYYQSPDVSGYVMIHGTAQLVDDPIVKQQHWKKEWQVFYPRYPNDYLLIKVTPE